jgi:hypothetical protein
MLQGDYTAGCLIPDIAGIRFRGFIEIVIDAVNKRQNTELRNSFSRSRGLVLDVGQAAGRRRSMCGRCSRRRRWTLGLRGRGRFEARRCAYGRRRV